MEKDLRFLRSSVSQVRSGALVVLGKDMVGEFSLIFANQCWMRRQAASRTISVETPTQRHEGTKARSF
jgi:hypothetical protein